MNDHEIPVGDEQLAGVTEELPANPPTRVRIVLDLVVTDAPALWQYALKRHFEAWDQPLGDSYDDGLTIAHAVLEALVISNENPDNNAIGIELLTYDVEPLNVDPTAMTYAQAVDLFGETGIPDVDLHEEA